jgi:archaemetzincin
MKIGILKIGQADPQVLERIQENLRMIFPKTTCTLIAETFTIPEDAFDETRNQYRSDIILAKIRDHTQKKKSLDRILGIVDADIFVPQLNFVFGEAMYPGKVAVISLWRLRPEFHGKPPKTELFIERSTKEAVHEIGHTLGLAHCSNPFCVMYLSNSIFDTDRKQSLFCKKCHLKIETAIDEIG